MYQLQDLPTTLKESLIIHYYNKNPNKNNDVHPIKEKKIKIH